MSLGKNTTLLKALNDCALECNYCFAACLVEQNVKMLSKCIKLDVDCASICQLTSSLIARGSEHGIHLLKECAEICDACASECERHDMEHCKACAEECRVCADECRAMLETRLAV
jgi:hypothetical protein